MNTRIIAKAAIFSPTGEILAIQRSKTDIRRPLQWDLPGGYCDPGEEPSEAVLREISEEAGLKINSVKLIYAKTEIRTWVEEIAEKTENVIFLFYVTGTDNKDVQLSHEHSAHQWMMPPAAIKKFEYPLHKEFLQHLSANQLV